MIANTACPTCGGTANSSTDTQGYYEYDVMINVISDPPRYTHFVMTSWRGTKEIVKFIRVDSEGLMTTTSQIWNRTAKEILEPNQGPPKRLRFLTANRCDRNRGRSWDRKVV